MIAQRKFLIATIVILLCTFSSVTIAASTGTIDPSNTGSHFAGFVHSPTSQAGDTKINFGKYTTATADNISISAGSLHGYAWSPIAGWIIMNCANTVSGCSSTNQNFKVAVATDTGILSGYAWGQQTGWINFGPFANNVTSQVAINQNGNFGGVGVAAGYAWSEKYGWIVFDCTNSATCVVTDFTPTQPVTPVTPVTPPNNVGYVSGGGFPPGYVAPSIAPTITTQPTTVTPTQPTTTTPPKKPNQNPSTSNSSLPNNPPTDASGAPQTINGNDGQFSDSGLYPPNPILQGPTSGPSVAANPTTKPSNILGSDTTPTKANVIVSGIKKIFTNPQTSVPVIFILILLLIALIRFL